MEWIKCSDRLPEENEYVLISHEGYSGISRLTDGEWDCGSFRKRPMFNNSERICTKIDPDYWQPLPEASKEE